MQIAGRRKGMKQKSTLVIAAIVLAAGLYLPVSGLLAFGLIQKWAELKIQGQYRPVPFLPRFHIKEASFTWADKVELVSGHLVFYFDPFYFLKFNRIRVQIKSQGVQAKLLGRWAEIQGEEDVLLTSFYADLGFAAKGLDEIYRVSADGPKFQFQVHQAESS